MPTLTLNGAAVPFEPGATILEAARAAGVDIPTLCWYPKLPIVGNCRVCLVSVQGQGKLLPACATPAVEGMVVETEAPAAVETRRGVLELLLERYPGEHLSNGGRAHPRNEFERYVVQYDVPVRETRELPLREGDDRPGDVMIQHDMSTCILCTRCVRACEDIQEVGVLDVALPGRARPDHRRRRRRSGPCRLHLVRRVRTRLPHRRDLRVHSPSSASAPRPFASPIEVVRSVCPYCGVGCQIDIHVKAGQIMRVTSPWHRGIHAQPGLDLREGPVRLRLSPAPGPAHGPAHPEGMDVATGGGGTGPESGRAIARARGHGRGDGRARQAASSAAQRRQAAADRCAPAGGIRRP